MAFFQKCINGIDNESLLPNGIPPPTSDPSEPTNSSYDERNADVVQQPIDAHSSHRNDQIIAEGTTVRTNLDGKPVLV